MYFRNSNASYAMIAYRQKYHAHYSICVHETWTGGGLIS